MKIENVGVGEFFVNGILVVRPSFLQVEKLDKV